LVTIFVVVVDDDDYDDNVVVVWEGRKVTALLHHGD
jgi:hypothetical protein